MKLHTNFTAIPSSTKLLAFIQLVQLLNKTLTKVSVPERRLAA
jgi:hypothetical protein